MDAGMMMLIAILLIAVVGAIYFTVQDRKKQLHTNN